MATNDAQAPLLDSVSTEELPSHERDDRLWFADGNIKIRVEDKMDFLIHRGVIARHSPVFAKKLLEVPMTITPKDSNEPRIPILVLPRKKYETRGITNILLAIYEPEFWNCASYEIPLTDILNMAHYTYIFQMESLFRQAIRHLQYYIPQPLEFPWGHPAQKSSILTRQLSVDHLLQALRVVILSRIIWFLPSLTYELCLLSTRQVTTSNYWTTLTPGMQQYILHARYELSSNWSILNFFAHLPASRCLSRPECEKINKRWYLEMIAERERHRRALKELTFDVHGSGTKQHICEPCTIVAKEIHLQSLKKIWEDLPKVFYANHDWKYYRALEKMAITEFKAFKKESEKWREVFQ
ncbi:hypothetical protein CVT24_000318 [Panaeolus cyanescens]|uniref:BTB domain-containing protein n=1 Tax=Panaeolus cyanescens TaxID=181874 RepID=A0A409YCY0_9AGAR|nr:hypothetical protein CVT24_000318 [Panaeolus cyanescens]